MAARGGKGARGTDVLRVESGALGPVPKCTLDIRPLTAFVGPQGTGKSLVAQVLYVFEELPFLIGYAASERGSGRKTDEVLFRSLLDRMRSGERRFATFAPNNAHVVWRRSSREDWPEGVREELEFRAYRATGAIHVRGSSATSLSRLRRAERALHHAVFFPTERIIYPQIRSVMQFGSLPLTYALFDHWVEEHGGRLPEVDDPEVLRACEVIERLGRGALGGRPRQWGTRWMWDFETAGRKDSIDLDLASSGQKANWTLPYLARSLLALRGTGDIAEDLTFFIEEPEIHLHPKAQREMVEILALLVNRGFRAVVTTHSLTVLYELNNLLQASRVRAQVGDGLPEPDFRLDPSKVSVYAMQAGEAPRQLVDRESAFIDERELGWVNEDLAEELNKIGTVLTKTN